MKSKKIKITFIVLDIVIILIVLYLCFGYLNFTRLKNNKEPICNGYVTEKSNAKTNLKVYNYGLYKLVRNETIDSNVSYSMKLWFLKDE